MMCEDIPKDWRTWKKGMGRRTWRDIISEGAPHAKVWPKPISTCTKIYASVWHSRKGGEVIFIKVWHHPSQLFFYEKLYLPSDTSKEDLDAQLEKLHLIVKDCAIELDRRWNLQVPRKWLFRLDEPLPDDVLAGAEEDGEAG